MQIQHLLSTFVILFLALGCSPQSKTAQNGPYKVRLLWNEDQKGVLFQFIELFSLSDLKQVQGEAARFYIHPKVVNGRLDGPTPSARYTVNSSGEIIPRDVLSSQLYTVYAHMERLMNLDAQLGIKNINTWPRDIGVAVRYMDSGSALVNNAMYAPQFDAMLFVPYKDSKLPITLNAGVIAHEHFHSLFYKIAILPFSEKSDFKKQVSNHDQKQWIDTFNISDRPTRTEENILTKDEAELYHLFLLKSINEGLADFWGWLYSQNTNFVGDSLSIIDDSRELKPQSIRMVKTEVFLKNLNAMPSDSMRASYVYQVGTLYAQIFKNYSAQISLQKNISQAEAQLQVAKAIIAILPTIGERLQVKNTLELVPTDYLTQLFVNQLGELTSQDCDYFESIQSEKAQETLFEGCKK